MSESISTSQLNDALGSNTPPLVFDVRKKPAFDSDPRTIKCAEWKIHDAVTTWASEVPQDSQVVVYCVHGHEVSQSAARTLRDLGFDSFFLKGGIAEWIKDGYEVS